MLNIISFANMNVSEWTEYGMHTNSHTVIKMDDPTFLILPLSSSSSWFALTKRTWLTNTHAFKREKKWEKRLLQLYPAREMHVSLVWQLSVLSCVLSHTFKVDLLHYMSRETTRKRKRKNESEREEGGRNIKNCCLSLKGTTNWCHVKKRCKCERTKKENVC